MHESRRCSHWFVRSPFIIPSRILERTSSWLLMDADEGSGPLCMSVSVIESFLRNELEGTLRRNVSFRDESSEMSGRANQTDDCLHRLHTRATVHSGNTCLKGINI